MCGVNVILNSMDSVVVFWSIATKSPSLHHSQVLLPSSSFYSHPMNPVKQHRRMHKSSENLLVKRFDIFNSSTYEYLSGAGTSSPLAINTRSSTRAQHTAMAMGRRLRRKRPGPRNPDHAKKELGKNSDKVATKPQLQTAKVYTFPSLEVVRWFIEVKAHRLGHQVWEYFAVFRFVMP